MKNFAGKSAIVTGAASGVGLGIALAFARAGMNVALADIRPDALAAAKRQVEALGARALALTVDVSDAASVEAAARAVGAAFGKLHIAVNNAGIAMHGTPVEKLELRDWNLA